MINSYFSTKLHINNIRKYFGWLVVRGLMTQSPLGDMMRHTKLKTAKSETKTLLSEYIE